MDNDILVLQRFQASKLSKILAQNANMHIQECVVANGAVVYCILKSNNEFVTYSDIAKILTKCSQNKGKHLKLDKKLIKSVFRNEITKKETIAEFCRTHPVTRNKYYRIIKQDYKDRKDREKLRLLREEVERELDIKHSKILENNKNKNEDIKLDTRYDRDIENILDVRDNIKDTNLDSKLELEEDTSTKKFDGGFNGLTW